jgi:hypothetical protein
MDCYYHYSKILHTFRLLARESLRNAISKFHNNVYVILLIGHIH